MAAQENNELPRGSLYQYSLIAKGEKYSYFLQDWDYNGDIHNVDVYKIIKLTHETGVEFSMFNFCAGKPLHTNGKCHSIKQLESELFFQITIEADTSSFISFPGPNNEKLTYKNKGKFFVYFSFKIENPFSEKDKLIEIKREGDAVEGFNSKCFETIKVEDASCV